jgi:long-subunit acyl-CoA synthetase (AMP-forming)/predicted GNAT family acetyltransferase
MQKPDTANPSPHPNLSQQLKDLEHALALGQAPLPLLRPPWQLETAESSTFEALQGLTHKALQATLEQQHMVFRSLLSLFLDPVVRRALYAQRHEVALLISQWLEGSAYSLQTHFFFQAERLKDKPLLVRFDGPEQVTMSWQEAAREVLHLQAVLEYLSKGTPKRFGLFAANSMPSALIDLALLTSDHESVIIPANATPDHIEFILNATETPVLFVGDQVLLEKIRAIKKQLKFLETVVYLPGQSTDAWVESLPLLKHDCPALPQPIRQIKDLRTTASYMFTSGTTGEPKGIVFNHLNIIYKRFCRALALPDIGEEDRFLSYLPLFHTFGRFLEWCGCIFWGSTYYFLENPGLETLVQRMLQVRPTVFISIPKKWSELFEYATSGLDLAIEAENRIKNTYLERLGGSLRFGLSAAGYLPPAIFRYFQSQGVELMSGFGMTEATGGITMTPPGAYRDDSLGQALPGIAIQLADDGELLIRGDYVMQGYFGKDASEVFNEEGWLPTGDIMTLSDDGQITIVDRKKEIYKNTRGETIAPQKIENFFREFSEVGQVFLVGDHRSYNTVLIYPNPEKEAFLATLSGAQKADIFSNMVVAVNRFLSPFERILDLRLIQRPFSVEHGELTPKGTYKRRVIEEHFKHLIEEMYQESETHLRDGSVTLPIPNWFLKEFGLLSRDLQFQEGVLTLLPLKRKLTVKRNRDGSLQFGSICLDFAKDVFPFKHALVNPTCWVGNRELFAFTGRQLLQWQRKFTFNPQWRPLAITPHPFQGRRELEALLQAREISSYGIHLAALGLGSSDTNDTQAALSYLELVAQQEGNDLQQVALWALMQSAFGVTLNTRRQMIQRLMPRLQDASTIQTVLRDFLRRNPELLDRDTVLGLNRMVRNQTMVAPLMSILDDEWRQQEGRPSLHHPQLQGLLDLLVSFGIKHPTQFTRIRRLLVHYQMKSKTLLLAQWALQARQTLEKGFREWLGPNQAVAVNLDNGREYGWEDVMIFEEGFPSGERQAIEHALSQTALIREAIFIMTQGALIRLSDILPGGAWVSILEQHQNFLTCRVSIQTRFQGAYDFAITLNQGLHLDQLLDQLDWQILASAKETAGQILVGEFFGYWEEHQLFSFAYKAGDSVLKFFTRQSRKLTPAKRDRLFHIWPFIVWNATTAYLRFWRLTDYETQLVPDPAHLFVPPHDYQQGTRLIKLAPQRQESRWSEFLKGLIDHFILPIEEQFPQMANPKIWTSLFAGIVTAEGEEQGKVQLRSWLRHLEQAPDFPRCDEIQRQLTGFLQSMEQFGVTPKRVVFAANRYHRWHHLNPQATNEVAAAMLNELWSTYRLDEIQVQRSDARTRFFLLSVFQNAHEGLKEELWQLARAQQHAHLTLEEVRQELSKMMHFDSVSDQEIFFLTRLGYPHLRPGDEAILLESPSSETNLLVQLEDDQGDSFSIRAPIHPKEISALHDLFLQANLMVGFRSEHRFLVALSSRHFIIGGLFFHQAGPDWMHMEKIVVKDQFRRKGVSEGLMTEWFNRMRNDGIKTVSTGFFRPEYFYRFGFKTDQKFVGLVKDLQE